MRSLLATARAVSICAGALGLTAGCADDTRTSWENPNLPWERWRVDEAECRDAAKDRAERDFALRQFENPPQSSYSRNEPVVSSLNQFEANKQIDRLFARCMTERGYRQVTRKAED
jgi:hypothetical protein